MIVKPNHIIWSDQIDYEDWREEMETEYPDKTEQSFEYHCSEGAISLCGNAAKYHIPRKRDISLLYFHSIKDGYFTENRY